MATVTVKQVIPHPDGAVIVVPEDAAQRSFCITKEHLDPMGGVKGDLYPCKPDIFKQTYEKAE